MINQKYLLLYKRKKKSFEPKILDISRGSYIRKAEDTVALYFDPFLNYDWYLITWNMYWEIKELEL
jgi:hypothetical protein